jgi:tRNA(fMet)-specific endonuclease VapC
VIRFVFDTDVLSAVIRRSPDLNVVRRVAAVPAEQQSTTAITAGELIYGATRRGSAALVERVERLLDGAIVILPFDAEAATVYGRTRAELESAGTPLGEADLRIASICLARDLTLVTGNERHFGRIAALRVENWLAPSRGA